MPDTYQDIARGYADGVRALFALPVAAPSREAGAQAAPAVAEQADQLLILSVRLTQAASAGLSDASVSARQAAEQHLLAKAMADLQVSGRLLEAAQAEAGEAALGSRGGERLPDVEESLGLLLEAGTTPAAAGRGAAVPGVNDLAQARSQLTATVRDSLELIAEQAIRQGQGAVSGLLVVGLSDVAAAGAVVGLDIAKALGQAEQVSRLYRQCREFALNAYNALLALLGPGLAKTVAQQMVAWTNDVATGQEFAKLIGKYYQLAATKEQVDQLVSQSRAPMQAFVAAIQSVDDLGSRFLKQMTQVEKLLRGLRLVSAIPAGVMPQAKLLLAACFLSLGGYAILSGADYADAERIKLLDRVPGVRRMVEDSLGSAS